MALLPNINFKTPLREISERSITKFQSAPDHSGGFGDVWKCSWFDRSRNSSATVAVKTVRVPDINQTKSLEKTALSIRREAYVWVNLEDDNVLPLHGITTGFGVLPAFVSLWMANGSLESYLKRYTSLATPQRLEMARQIASGLKYLHDNGIVHGDLTPKNVLIDNNHKLCLSDFGLSVVLAESGNPTFNSFHSGNVRWMAPEILDVPDLEGEVTKPTKPTKPADVYSYGCIMLQLLSGKQPYYWLFDVLHVCAAIFRGVAPFRQIIGVDAGHMQYSLMCLSADANARPMVQEILKFMKAELRKYH